MVLCSQNPPPVAQDSSVVQKKQWPILVGVDVYGLAKPLFSDQTRLNAFAAIEIIQHIQFNFDIGFHSGNFNEMGWHASAAGTYAKLGANYMISRDYSNPQNVYYVGGKMGYSRSTLNVTKFPIYGPDQLPSYGFLPKTKANSWWAEISLGARVEILKKLIYTELQFQPKILILKKSDLGIDPLFVPGFGKNKNKGINADIFWGLVIQIF